MAIGCRAHHDLRSDCPPAPGRLSTTTVCFHMSWSWRPTMRPAMSAPEAGVSGYDHAHRPRRFSCDNAGVAARAASAHIILKRIKTPPPCIDFFSRARRSVTRRRLLPRSPACLRLRSSLTELAARHDLTVAFDCEAFPREPELIDKLAYAQRLFELPWLSVDRDRNHCL